MAHQSNYPGSSFLVLRQPMKLWTAMNTAVRAIWDMFCNSAAGASTTAAIPCDTRECRKSYGRSKDRKSTRLNSSHVSISYAVFCLKKKTELQSRFDLGCRLLLETKKCSLRWTPCRSLSSAFISTHSLSIINHSDPYQSIPLPHHVA